MSDKQGNPKQATLNLVKRMIDNAWFYAGFVEYPSWGISRRKGQHEALISIETYENIKKRYKARKYVMKRRETKEKFYLRGIVFCECCGKQIYGAQAAGRNSRYGYYYCNNRKCTEYRKAIRMEKFHSMFIDYLKEIQPSEYAISKLYQLGQDWYEQELKTKEQNYDEVMAKITQMEKESDILVEKLATTTSKGIEEALCRRIEVIELNKAKLHEELESSNHSASNQVTQMQDVDRVCEFLRNLPKCWENAGYEGKRAILNGLFDSDIKYSEKSSFRNGGNPLLDWLSGLNSEMKTRVVEIDVCSPKLIMDQFNHFSIVLDKVFCDF